MQASFRRELIPLMVVMAELFQINHFPMASHWVIGYSISIS